MVLEKGKPTTYPVTYTVWRKVRGARFTYDSTLEEFTKATVRLNFVAESVDPSDPTSPWLTARPKAIKAVRKVLGKSDYEAHEGVNTGGANAVYWVDIVYKRTDGLVVVRNITEGAKVKVDEVTEPIEPDLLYPLLRGRDVRRWKAQPSAWILMVQDPEERRGYDEEWLQENCPRTYGYLKRFEEVLRERAAFKRYFTRKDKNGRIVETGPFYSMFDVGTYTFAPWKVVWTRVANDIAAAVVGHANVADEHKPVVPIETATLVDFTDFTEAHYFCAVVNSCPWRLVIVSTAVHGTGGFGSPNVLDKARIPRFDRKNPVHLRLAELSMQAHEAGRIGDEMRLREIEVEIDLLAAKLWNLSDDELREIQESLSELEGEEVTE